MASHSGRSHWIQERITAVVNVPLSLWLVWSVVQMPDWNYETVMVWFSAPVNAVLMLLAIVAIFYHAALGIRVIIEDYVHHKGMKMAALLGNNLVFLVAAVGCIFSVLKIAFTG